LEKLAATEDLNDTMDANKLINTTEKIHLPVDIAVLPVSGSAAPESPNKAKISSKI